MAYTACTDCIPQLAGRHARHRGGGSGSAVAGISWDEVCERAVWQCCVDCQLLQLQELQRLQLTPLRHRCKGLLRRSAMAALKTFGMATSKTTATMHVTLG